MAGFLNGLKRSLLPLVIAIVVAASGAVAAHRILLSYNKQGFGPLGDVKVFNPKRVGKQAEPIEQAELTIVTASEVDDKVKPHELVLGVVVNDEARAYPLNMLTGPTREVLNDELGGEPIVATWSPYSHNAIVYSRKVDDRVLKFAVSGWLWIENPLLLDAETNSMWSQLLGEAKKGELKGTRLDQHPSLLTDWVTWTTLHPETTAVVAVRGEGRTTELFQRERYGCAVYRTVLGISRGQSARAWRFVHLPAALNDQVGDDNVLVTFDSDTFTARLFDRRIDGDVLTFAMKDGELTDKQTDSVWDPLSGLAMSGSLEGKQLVVMPAIESNDAIWQTFHPHSKFGTRR